MRLEDLLVLLEKHPPTARVQIRRIRGDEEFQYAIIDISYDYGEVVITIAKE